MIYPYLIMKHNFLYAIGQYAQSKLANIMFASELARREKQIALQSDSPPVLSVSLHPGLVRTDVVRNMPIFLKLGNIAFGFLLRTLQKAPYAGAYTSVFCTISNNLELKNGLYFSNSAVTNTSVVATEEHVRFSFVCAYELFILML